MDPDKTNEALVAARDLALNAGQALANASGGSGDAAADFFQRVVVSALKKLASQSPPPDEVPAAISIIKAIRRAESSQKSRGDSHLAAVHELFPPPSPVSLSFRPLRRTNLARSIDPHLSSSMAGRFGLGPSSTADSMTVVNTPNQDLALTNFAYCASTDLNKFAASGSNHVFVLVGDAIVLTLRAHQSIPSNHIALNAIQRRHTRVSSGDQISVARFIPPANFKLALLTLELDFVKAKTSRIEQLDAVVITQQLQRKFIDQDSLSLMRTKEKGIIPLLSLMQILRRPFATYDRISYTALLQFVHQALPLSSFVRHTLL